MFSKLRKERAASSANERGEGKFKVLGTRPIWPAMNACP